MGGAAADGGVSDLRVTTLGKEMLLDGSHLADFVSPEAAEAVAVALNYGTFPCRAPVEEVRKVWKLFE